MKHQHGRKKISNRESTNLAKDSTIRLTSSTTEDLNSIDLSDDRVWLCQHCGLDFMHALTLNQHIIDVHGISLSNGNINGEIFRCKMCSETFDCSSDFHWHMNDQHGMKFSIREDDNLANNINSARAHLHLCQLCGKTFTHLTKLNKHLSRTHKVQSNRHLNKNQVIKCHLCSKAFAHWSSVRRHKRMCHNLETSNLSLKMLSTHKDETVTKQLETVLKTFPSNIRYKATLKKTKSMSYVIFEFPILNPEEIQKWKILYEEKNNLFLRRCYRRKSRNESVIFAVKYRCWHNVRVSKHAKCDRTLTMNTKCPFYLFIRVMKEKLSLIAKLRIAGEHNHHIGHTDSAVISVNETKISETILTKRFPTL